MNKHKANGTQMRSQFELLVLFLNSCEDAVSHWLLAIKAAAAGCLDVK